MKILLTTATAALTLLGACTTPSPICDREAQEWSKFGTQEDLCAPTPSKMVGLTERPDDVTLPTPPQGPTSPPVAPPSGPETPPSDDGGDPKRDKPKGDNSDANGKGGNKHDRDDFTHGGTEVAEGKKG